MTNRKREFCDKIALVTGAGRGLGRFVALELAARGAHVFLLGRSSVDLEEVYDMILEAGGEATGTPMDLRDFDALDRLGAILAERRGRLDLLVGNAAVPGPLTPTSQIDSDALRDALDVNVVANARLIRAMEPLLMRAEAPRAAFVTSGAAYRIRPFRAAYAMSKAALNALVQTWAMEHENDKLRINLFAPGPLRTAMRALVMPGEDPESVPPPETVVPALMTLLGREETRSGEIIRP